ALVLLAKLPIKRTMRAGDRLVIGPLTERVPEVGDSELLTTRLDQRGELDDLAGWRFVQVDASRPLHRAVKRPLARAVGLAAARLIAVDEEGTLRPAPDQPTVWDLSATPGDGDADVEAVVELARWVGQDLSENRLNVARHVAAQRIQDPLQGGPAQPLLDAAKIAYRLAVHADVLESLERQQKLEEAFRDLDDKAAEMRASIDNTLDASVTKALAGALAITIAALTSAKVRDWPATIAASVLAGYLAVNAVGLARWRRDDAD